MTSETLTSTNILNNTSLLPKELILDNTYIVETKLPSKSVTFYLLVTYPKVPLYVTLNKELVTEVYSPEPPELMLPLSVTPKMDLKPESDYLLVPEKPYLDYVELP